MSIQSLREYTHMEKLFINIKDMFTRALPKDKITFSEIHKMYGNHGAMSMHINWQRNKHTYNALARLEPNERSGNSLYIELSSPLISNFGFTNERTLRKRKANVTTSFTTQNIERIAFIADELEKAVDEALHANKRKKQQKLLEELIIETLDVNDIMVNKIRTLDDVDASRVVHVNGNVIELNITSKDIEFIAFIEKCITNYKKKVDE